MKALNINANNIDFFKKNSFTNSLQFVYTFVLLFLLFPVLLITNIKTSNSTIFLLFIFLFILGLVMFNIGLKIYKNTLLFLFFIIIVIHTVICDMTLFYYTSKQLKSLFLLFIFLVVLGVFCNVFWNTNEKIISLLLYIFFYTFILIYIVSIFWHYNPDYYNKSIFPFSEPSFFALNFSIFLSFVLIRSSVKNSLFLLFILMGIHMENLTFFVILVVIFMILLKLNFKLFIGLLFIITIILVINFFDINLTDIFEDFDINYYLNRLTINEDSSNLTSLCYGLGIEMARKDFINTYGLGVGFQQMGTIFTNYNFNFLIILIFGKPLNIHDGTFFAAKLISELGILGILFLLYYLKCLKNTISIFFNKIPINNNKILLIHIIILTSFVDLFIRSQGSYFTPKFFLLCFALLSYSDINKMTKIPNLISI